MSSSRAIGTSLNSAFREPRKDHALATFSTIPADECPYAMLGQVCTFKCNLCSLRHECIYCGFNTCQELSSIYPPNVPAPLDWFDPPPVRPGDIPIYPSAFEIPFLDSFSDDEKEEEDDEKEEEDTQGRSQEVLSSVEDELSNAEEEETGIEVNSPEASSKGVGSEEKNEQSSGGEENEETEWEGFDDDTDKDTEGNRGEGGDIFAESDLDTTQEDEPLPQTSIPTDIASSACVNCDEPDHWDIMIVCENHEAWYHLRCVGLTEIPDGDWYCPDCTATSSRQLKARQRRKNRSPTPSSDESPKSLKKKRNSKTVKRKAEKGKDDKPRKKKTTQWTTRERELAVELMKEVMGEQEVGIYDSEKKFAKVSERLMERYSVDRTEAGIKSQWRRELRSNSNFDERRTPNPQKMKTSYESSEKRRKARQKRKAEEELVEDEDEDGAAASSSRKRLKSSASR